MLTLLRIITAWIVLSLTFTAFWVLLLEVGRRFGAGSAVKPTAGKGPQVSAQSTASYVAFDDGAPDEETDLQYSANARYCHERAELLLARADETSSPDAKVSLLHMIDHYKWLAELWESAARSQPISVFSSTEAL